MRDLRVNKKAVAASAAIMAVLPGAAYAAVDGETAFIFNSFSFLLNGALVMWMAAGFAMLEAGLVRKKNTATICLKNIGLYSVAALTFYLIGYNLMYMDVTGFMGSFSPFWTADDADALKARLQKAAAIQRRLTGSSKWFLLQQPPRLSLAQLQSASNSGLSSPSF